MTFFIALRSKMCTFLTKEEKCIKKAKGIKYCMLMNEISFQYDLECLQELREKVVEQRTIQSFAHNLFYVAQN